ncbi:MAG: alpha/beta fold hydrolase [Firmicutes bacterium]|uniref:Alpha/beta fold hydrolase n=1 Tax=Candidatus Alloenteromonas pullistercoris TaxID=2840785 RepID=A0A9D9GT96_9FIRM|nr:alpha/beta fold hydrolase [Candidatus Enteromonas pullistercoris]
MIFDLLLSRGFKKAFGHRGDGLPTLAYPPISSFGPKTKPFSFLSEGRRLYGEVAYPKDKPLGLIVFFHGLGAGYTAYSQEIAFYAEAGYLVYAFDYMGCMQSEGTGMGDLGHPLLDQRAFFAFLNGQDEAKGLSRYSVGHSWGGFLSCAALLEPSFGVKAAVSFAGFYSIPDIVCHSAPALRKSKAKVARYFKKRYGEVGSLGLSDIAAISQKPILYIQGDEDDVVPFSENYKRLQGEKLPKGFVLLLSKGRGHQPYWVKESYRYFLEVFEKGRPADFDRDPEYVVDYGKLQHDDPIIMGKTLAFIKEIDKRDEAE